jgi:glycine oxidase
MAAGAGASGGVVGALAPHVPEAWNTKKALQFESLEMAEAFWAEVAEASGRDPRLCAVGPGAAPCRRCGGGARAGPSSLTAAELWQGRYTWEVRDASAYPDLVHSATGLVVFDTLTARLHPRRAIAALVAALSKVGGVSRHRQTVTPSSTPPALPGYWS